LHLIILPFVPTGINTGAYTIPCFIIRVVALIKKYLAVLYLASILNYKGNYFINFY